MRLTMSRHSQISSISFLPNRMKGKGNRGKGSRGEGSRMKGNRVKGSRGEGSRVKGNRVKGNRVKGNRGKGNGVKGDRGKGSRMKGNRVKGNRGKGNGVKGMLYYCYRPFPRGQESSSSILDFSLCLQSIISKLPVGSLSTHPHDSMTHSHAFLQIR